MIEINLSEKKKTFKAPVVLGIDVGQISWIPLIIGVLIYKYPEGILKEQWEEDIKVVQEQINIETKKLKKIKRELKKNQGVKDMLLAFNEKIKTLKDRSVQVDKIIKERTNPRKLLEEVARSTPEDLWFNNLTISKDRAISISGASKNYKSIGEFIVQINETPYFGRSLQLADSKTVTEKIQGIDIRLESFEIKGNIAIFDPYIGQ